VTTEISTAKKTPLPTTVPVPTLLQIPTIQHLPKHWKKEIQVPKDKKHKQIHQSHQMKKVVKRAMNKSGIFGQHTENPTAPESASKKTTAPSKKRTLSESSSDDEQLATQEGFLEIPEKIPKKKRKYSRKQQSKPLLIEHKPLPDPKEFETVANVTSGKADLLTILPFIHRTSTDFFAQPEVNHRGINMKHIETTLSPAAVSTNPYGASFEDEIFLIVYEITDETKEVPVKSVNPPFKNLTYDKTAIKTISS